MQAEVYNLAVNNLEAVFTQYLSNNLMNVVIYMVTYINTIFNAAK